jgi:hypothetical protein
MKTPLNLKGILGVNIAPPKEPVAEASVTSATPSASPSKLTKLEGMATGEEGEECEFKVGDHFI